MQTITEKVKAGQLLVSDGAWGTFLQASGMKGGECPELWNIDHPDVVYNIAKSYIDAGADMIETNSFGGTSFKLQNYGLADRAYELNKAAAAISRKAAGPDKHVMGSMGPTGKILMMGDVTEEELYESFKEQALGLQDGGADVLVIETMSDIDEAKIAIRAAKENTNCEIICTMTFENNGSNEFYTMMGITPVQMVNDLIETGAQIIGANCGNGVEGMVGITKDIRSVNQDVPVLIHANAGVPVYKEGQTIFPESPDEMAGFVQQLVDAGANIIGGCCGTTPEHISKIAAVVKSQS